MRDEQHYIKKCEYDLRSIRGYVKEAKDNHSFFLAVMEEVESEIQKPFLEMDLAKLNELSEKITMRYLNSNSGSEEMAGKYVKWLTNTIKGYSEWMETRAIGKLYGIDVKCASEEWKAYGVDDAALMGFKTRDDAEAAVLFMVDKNPQWEARVREIEFAEKAFYVKDQKKGCKHYDLNIASRLDNINEIIFPDSQPEDGKMRSMAEIRKQDEGKYVTHAINLRERGVDLLGIGISQNGGEV